MDEASTRKIYDEQSLVYDKTFGRLVRKRIERAIAHMNVRPDDLVLDLGVGTGGSLGYYPANHGRVVGIDLSGGMLQKAQLKIRDLGMERIALCQANALELPFAENTFDAVFISHVISVVSDPCKAIREVQRVAKRGARMVILNHFQSPNRLLAKLEKLLCPLCSKLGWRTDLALHDLIKQTGVEIDYRYKLDMIDLWETVVISNTKSALAVTAEVGPAIAGALAGGYAVA
jgi:phosphatidylethanolamine/phosphatidyl-N-methylethanolamine N-methyltransferase